MATDSIGPGILLIKGGRVYDHDGDVDQPPVADLLIVDGAIAAVRPSLAAVCDPEPGPPTAADAIWSATIGGARTAGLQGRFGALKPGMAADLSEPLCRRRRWLSEVDEVAHSLRG